MTEIYRLESMRGLLRSWVWLALSVVTLLGTVQGAPLVPRVAQAADAHPEPCPVNVDQGATCLTTVADLVTVQERIEEILGADVWIPWGLAADGLTLGLVTRTNETLGVVSITVRGTDSLLITITPLTPLELANGHARFAGGMGSLSLLDRPAGVYVTVTGVGGTPLLEWSSLPPGTYTAHFSTPGQLVSVPFTVRQSRVFLTTPGGLHAGDPVLTDAPLDTVALLLDPQGRPVRDIVELPDGQYQLYVARRGFESVVLPTFVSKGRSTPVLMPPLQALRPAQAQTTLGWGGYVSGGSLGGLVFVNGYTRADGTYVQPYLRSAPRR